MNSYTATAAMLLVKFPASKAGLSTVGFTLKNSDGGENTARSTDGVVNLGNGAFSTTITKAEPWIGSILWDTGEETPLVAIEEINITWAPATDVGALAASLWAADIPGAFPDGSAGKTLGSLQIPEYVGPIVVIPAPANPDIQMLVICAKLLGSAWAVGDTVTITPDNGQFSGANVLSNQHKRAVIGPNGIAQYQGVDGIPVDIGAKITVIVGTYFKRAIVVDDTPVKNLTEYFAGSTP